MNVLATELNNDIQSQASAVFKMLSKLGQEMFMPLGILTQGAQAKQKAHKFNATLGIATTGGKPMYIDAVYDNLKSFNPAEVFNYAPPAGVQELRELWQKKIYSQSPALEGKEISMPVVTNAITHGLSIVADLFCNEGDYIVLPDKFWGNYRQTFSLRRGAILSTFPIFNETGGFNVDALLEKVRECSKLKPKVFVLLNFPNNPTGYTLTKGEADRLVAGLNEVAAGGVQLVCVVDDAYYGMFYDDDCLKESVFGLLTEQNENLLAIKLDGATKEMFVWGFRVGFITFGATAKGQAKALNALAEKVKGNIRGDISNCAHPSQTAILKALKHPDFYAQQAKNIEILRVRAAKAKELLQSGKYDDRFVMYPFNSGYFLCLKLLRGVDSERLRQLLLDAYGVGTISTSTTDMRIAFSCVEVEDLEELFDIIYKAAGEM